MSSDVSSSGSTAATNDTFPEVAFFEVPNNASKSSISRHKEVKKHPAFRQISAINGEINRMNVKLLKIELEKLNFDGRGGKDVLKKRLKAYERSRILKEVGIEDPNTDQQHYTHIVVIDFEATCEEHQTKDYVHEIIEFPAVLVRVSDAARVGEFHSLVRPVLNPVLSDFCRQLTGIDQKRVDVAPTFPEVLRNFENWLAEKGVSTVTSTATLDASASTTESALTSPDPHAGPCQDGGVPNGGSNYTFAVATDGPWDMARFLLMQCSISELPFPSWARSWINLRKVFSNFYAMKRLCLSEMLAALGMEFQGRPHCGLDDARNIAVIAEALLRDGATLRVNETIAHLPHCAPPSLKGSSVASVTLKDFKSSQRRRHKSSCTGSSDHDGTGGTACADRRTVCDGSDAGTGGNGGSCQTDGGNLDRYSNGGDVGVSSSSDGNVDRHSNDSDVGVGYSGGSIDGVSSGGGSIDGFSSGGGSIDGVSYSAGGVDGVSSSACGDVERYSNGGGGEVSVCSKGGSNLGASNSSGDNKFDAGIDGEIQGSGGRGSCCSGDVADGCGQKDWLKKLCGGVGDLNVDFDNATSQKLINGSYNEPVGDVVNDLNRLHGSTSDAFDWKHSRPTIVPHKIHNDIDSDGPTNVAYRNIIYSDHLDSSHTVAPRFNNSLPCDSDISNPHLDTRCHSEYDGSESPNDLRVDTANSQQSDLTALKHGHSKGNNTRQSKNFSREPLPYTNLHDRRYMHYTQINSKANKGAIRRDYDVQGNSNSSMPSEINSQARKKMGGHALVTPANGKPVWRANNHRSSQYSSGNGEERYAAKGRRAPPFKRGAVLSTSERASQGFYSNATANNEASMHKNIDFNDSAQFPVLGSLRRSYK